MASRCRGARRSDARTAPRHRRPACGATDWPEVCPTVNASDRWSNRQAWRLHHVQPSDTLQTIARTYHVPAERIVAVNRATDSLESGDVLFIPAVYHEETRARHGRSWRARASIGVSAALRSNRSIAGHRSSRAASLPRVPSQVLHRKAVVRTAALEGE